MRRIRTGRCVIVLSGSCKYVALPGSKESYTVDFSKARIYPDYATAARDACGNESVQYIDN